jgi:hypothetical protein
MKKTGRTITLSLAGQDRKLGGHHCIPTRSPATLELGFAPELHTVPEHGLGFGHRLHAPIIIEHQKQTFRSLVNNHGLSVGVQR